MLLSPHFTLEEFLASQTASREGIDNSPTPEHLENLKRTAATMEKVRTLLGNKPIIVSSGYRSKTLNEQVGGSTTSAHCFGLACDFSCPGFGSPTAIWEYLRPHIMELHVDQLIDEYPPNGWVHLGLAHLDDGARHQVAVIDNRGFHLA